MPVPRGSVNPSPIGTSGSLGLRTAQCWLSPKPPRRADRPSPCCRLPTTAPAEHFDSQPAFSPDGKRMAFVRTSGPGVVDDLFLVPIEGGGPRRLTFDNRPIYGSPAWTEDGSDLVFSSARAGLQGLWRLPVSGGDPRPVAEAGTDVYYPAIATKVHRLAYMRGISNDNVWQLALKDRTHAQGKASMLIAAQGYAYHPQFSPDGTKIAFESNRSG